MKKILFLFSLVFVSLGFFVSPLHALAATYPELESVANDGTPANIQSAGASVSGDGRYVAFSSKATNIVPGAGGKSNPNIYVHDRQTGTTELISKASDGTPGDFGSGIPQITADGRYVVFTSGADNLIPNDTNATTDVFIYDRQQNIMQRVDVASDGTQANNGAGSFSISQDGRYITFSSVATNLVSGDTNGVSDVFVHDMQTGTTELISKAPDGTPANGDSGISSITPDGRYVAFDSGATNVTPEGTGGIFVRDRQTGTTRLVSTISVNARSVSISSDGRYVTFSDAATYLSDLQTGTTQQINGSQPFAGSTISADGNYIVFDSFIENTSQDTVNVYVYNRNTGITELVSKATDGTIGNNESIAPSFSQDGHYVVFNSQATNLVSTDTGGAEEAFLTVNPFNPPVTNSAPVVGTVSVTPNPAHINSTTSMNASFTDADTSDTHTATIDWGDGSATQSGTVTESNGSGTVTKTHTYTVNGSHTIIVKVTDNGGLTGAAQTTISVIPATGLIGGNIHGADYSGADLSGQNMLAANTRGTNFTGANLSNANLMAANASGANFTNANLTNANLIASNLRNANFTNANLTGANLTAANVNGAIWSNTICPNGTNSNTHNNSCAGQGGGL